MNKRIKSYLEKLFANTANDSQVLDIKEELEVNLNEKYKDLIESGKSEDEAFELVVAGIGDIDGLLKEMGYSSKVSSPSSLRSDGLLKEEEISLGLVKNIVIEGSIYTIDLYKTSGNALKVRQLGPSDTKIEDLFSVEVSNGTINIRNIVNSQTYRNNIFNFPFNFNFRTNNNSEDKRLIIEIPESFSGNLDLSTVSASIKVRDEFTLNNMNINSTSGSIKVCNKLNINNLNINSTSGSIKLAMGATCDGNIKLNSTSGSIISYENIVAKDSSATSSSGSIIIRALNVENYKLSSSSGSVKVDNISGGGHVSASSGSIKLSLVNPQGDIILESSSGSIKLTLEPSLAFNFQAQTSSGGIHTSFPIEKNSRGNHATATVGQNPLVNINAKASSGGIKVEQ